MPRLVSEMHSTDQSLPGSYTYYMGVKFCGKSRSVGSRRKGNDTAVLRVEQEWVTSFLDELWRFLTLLIFTLHAVYLKVLQPSVSQMPVFTTHWKAYLL